MNYRVLPPHVGGDDTSPVSESESSCGGMYAQDAFAMNDTCWFGNHCCEDSQVGLLDTLRFSFSGTKMETHKENVKSTDTCHTVGSHRLTIILDPFCH